jgi:predicted aldo/keto reductase-like oxidoreductase
MNPFDGIYPLGLGTNRFPIADESDEFGIESAVKLTLCALDFGVNYIDVAPGYSRGMAFEVLRRVFKQTKKLYKVTLKSRSDIDKSADDVRRRTELSLNSMGISRATYAVAWSIFSFEEFKEIINKGGMFEGMLKLKDEKIVEHICFSTHAPVPDIIKILDSGVFEGMTISYSLLNSAIMDEALDIAQKRDIGVVVMNPLGGGIIPQNRDFFSFACNDSESSTVQSALRFVKAHAAVKVVLTGVSNLSELEENLSAFNDVNSESDIDRVARVSMEIQALKDFCTGCNYCAGCPSGIPISAYMQSRNTLIFKPINAYNRTATGLLQNIQLFRKLSMDFHILPETNENPCIHCGQCEARCTQKLNIMDALEDIYKRIAESSYSKEGHKRRLDTLLNGHAYRRVGIYPSGGYFAWVSTMYHSLFGEPTFEYVLFNSDSKTWGTVQGGAVVHKPDDIRKLRPDIVLVSNYNYSDEIYNSIKHYEDDGIRIVKLHDDSDVPWLF